MVDTALQIGKEYAVSRKDEGVPTEAEDGVVGLPPLLLEESSTCSRVRTRWALHISVVEPMESISNVRIGTPSQSG
jgi:hypothetical protein